MGFDRLRAIAKDVSWESKVAGSTYGAGITELQAFMDMDAWSRVAFAGLWTGGKSVEDPEVLVVLTETPHGIIVEASRSSGAEVTLKYLGVPLMTLNYEPATKGYWSKTYNKSDAPNLRSFGVDNFMLIYVYRGKSGVLTRGPERSFQYSAGKAGLCWPMLDGDRIPRAFLAVLDADTTWSVEISLMSEAPVYISYRATAWSPTWYGVVSPYAPIQEHGAVGYASMGLPPQIDLQALTDAMAGIATPTVEVAMKELKAVEEAIIEGITAATEQKIEDLTPKEAVTKVLDALKGIGGKLGDLPDIFYDFSFSTFVAPDTGWYKVDFPKEFAEPPTVLASSEFREGWFEPTKFTAPEFKVNVAPLKRIKLPGDKMADFAWRQTFDIGRQKVGDWRVKVGPWWVSFNWARDATIGLVAMGNWLSTRLFAEFFNTIIEPFIWDNFASVYKGLLQTAGGANWAAKWSSYQAQQALNLAIPQLYAFSDMPKMKLTVVYVAQVTTRGCKVLSPKGAKVHMVAFGKARNPLDAFMGRSASALSKMMGGRP